MSAIKCMREKGVSPERTKRVSSGIGFLSFSIDLRCRMTGSGHPLSSFLGNESLLGLRPGLRFCSHDTAAPLLPNLIELVVEISLGPAIIHYQQLAMRERFRNILETYLDGFQNLAELHLVLVLHRSQAEYRSSLLVNNLSDIFFKINPLNKLLKHKNKHNKFISHSSQAGLSLNDAVRDLHLPAKSWEPHDQLNRVDIMSNNNQLGLVLQKLEIIQSQTIT